MAAEVQSRTRVVLENDLEDNPKCVHGPMLLFSREIWDNKGKTSKRTEFFGCSACRNPKDCTGAIPGSEKGYQEDNLKAHLELYDSRKKNSSQYYCSTCNILAHDTKRHSSCSIKPVTEEDIDHPTRILMPNSRDKTEAQYFFSPETTDQILHILKDINCNKTICMGTPRLHEAINDLPGYRSLLLDFDTRLRNFYPPHQLLLYNMFNHYFFCGDYSRSVFSKFLKNDSRRDKVCLLVDPPFGCRTEALSFTLKRIQMEYMIVNQEILPVIWVFPYFMERYLNRSMPEMQMLDYKVSYTNHPTYNNEIGRFGSPVRLFTNAIPRLVKFREGFKYCQKCEKFTRLENIHCNTCQTCPSKNGAVYRHCLNCATCVKPYYQHCFDCNRCAQSEGHDCVTYQKNAFCWICDEKGHVEKDCMWIKSNGKAKKVKNKKTSIRICVICRKPNHNEKQCRVKKNLFK